ncbi:lipoprotein-releasing ABC transporter permease subunit [Lentisalinibacter salinarum]|uniref:lipoprotein-releasing ABC transporter permease subunit n=1 Tax=Lentisalinibacter salinarum TaxID=2992239 RepID=UPI003867566F
MTRLATPGSPQSPLARYWEWLVGIRYVRSRHRNSFVSFISLISMAGIAVGVMVLIVVLSVVNGFERELQERILAMSAEATIEGPAGRLEDWQRLAEGALADPRVRAVAPFVSGRGLVAGAGAMSGIAIRGVDPAREKNVSGIEGLMREGSLADLQPRSYRVILGVDLADALGVAPGEQVLLMLAEGVVTPAGLIPRMRRFTVVGTFRAGMYEFDRRQVFMHIDDAARLFRLGDDVSGLRLALGDLFGAPAIVREVATSLGGGVLVSDWTRRHSGFFRSIKITKSILFVILLLVIAVAAFNIVSTLVMVVKDKQRDIAILRTLGAPPGGILSVFVIQGAIIGVIGTGIGLALGAALTLNLETIVGFAEGALGFKFLAPDVYFISDLPADLRAGDLALICGVALALSLLSTLYPAWRGARTDPADALRFD